MATDKDISNQTTDTDSARDITPDSDNTHYMFGQLSEKVTSLEKSIESIKANLNDTISEIKRDLRLLLGAGCGAVVLILGLFSFFYDKLDNALIYQTQTITAEIKNLDESVRQNSEDLIRLEERNANTLSRIETTLGRLALRNEDSSSSLQPSINPDPARPEQALPFTDDIVLAEKSDPGSSETSLRFRKPISTEHLNRIVKSIISESELSEDPGDTQDFQSELISEEVSDDPVQAIPSVLAELEVLGVDFNAFNNNQKMMLVSLFRERDQHILRAYIEDSSETVQKNNSVSDANTDPASIIAEYEERLRDLIESFNDEIKPDDGG